MNQAEVEARCLTLFGRLVELLDGHAWARDLFDAMLAEAGADDEEIDSERFCGAPRVLSRVARDLMTIPNQKERALSALAALARFDAVDGAAAKELLAALKNKADGPAAAVARVAGWPSRRWRGRLHRLQGAQPRAPDEARAAAVPAFAA